MSIRFNRHVEYRGKTIKGAINKVGRFMANARTSDVIDDCKCREAWEDIKATLKSEKIKVKIFH